MAGFLGVSNLLEGEVVGRDGGLATFRLPDGTVLARPGDGVATARPVRIGVRPEKLRVVAGDDGAGARDASSNALEGTVLDSSYIGVSTQYLVQTATAIELIVYAQNLETAGAGGAAGRGQRVPHLEAQHTFVISGRHRARRRRSPRHRRRRRPDV